MPTTRTRIRLLIDLSDPFASLSDLLTTATNKRPTVARNFDLQIEVGLAENGSLQTDVSQVASISVEIKRARAGEYAPSADDALLLGQTIAAASMNTGLTQNAWDSLGEADAHAVFEFTGSETANAPSANLWLTIYVTTTDAPARRLLYASALINCEESGAPSTGDPTGATGDEFYTTIESDARYQLLNPANANFRIKNGNELQIRETAPTVGWRTLFSKNGALKLGQLDET